VHSTTLITDDSCQVHIMYAFMWSDKNLDDSEFIRQKTLRDSVENLPLCVPDTAMAVNQVTENDKKKQFILK